MFFGFSWQQRFGRCGLPKTIISFSIKCPSSSLPTDLQIFFIDVVVEVAGREQETSKN
jgi:hypothetical protein